ncbi:hypothetical protein P7D15_02575 [Bacillus cereus]|uniref:Uncharacterized protein n=1 Tax=Bacillus thuringiensis TaxID=1428 RepID=A0A9X6Z4Y9_BACTU|nr:MULTISPECIES: hypothetical protein [Bacillus cereus group]MDF9599306.1 hypothetical protein [Bacillus cereus]MDG1589637.1 hypothetical protein [Bacillus cereus]MEC3270749.1 hypothetical protein [Bacillus thuringiensis]PFB08032.1 hypothetical protein CN398_09930 [Bacillus thuringiensis]SME48505.1 hypothetical protein BACERE00183_04118 [Bacillus cereus]
MENKNTIVLSAEMDMEIEEVKASMKGKSSGIPQVDVLVIMATLVNQKKPHTTAWLNESSYNYKVLIEALVNGYEVEEEFTDEPIEEETKMEKGKVTIEIDFTGEGVQIQFNGNPNDYQKAIQTVVKNEEILEFIANKTVEGFGVEEDTEKVCCMSGGSCPFGGERFFANLLGLPKLPKELKETEEYQEFMEEMKEVHEVFKMFGHPFGEIGFVDAVPQGVFEGMIPFLHKMSDSFTTHANPEDIFSTIERLAQTFTGSQMAPDEDIELEHGDVMVLEINGYQEDVRFFILKNQQTGYIQLMSTKPNLPFRIPNTFTDSDKLFAFLNNHPKIKDWDIIGNVNDTEPQVA